MSEREDVVTAVLTAAGGELTGRVRLQKTVYLLDCLGLESGFAYEYHHYGPFSRDLENATADAKAFDLIEEKFDHRQSDGAVYSIFALKTKHDSPAFGKLNPKRASELVRRFALTNVTVLELAATINWLGRVEKYPDWKSEVKKRKGIKVQNGRLEKAVELLTDLNLRPPPIPT
jgi:uncharacterized protein YwgA